MLRVSIITVCYNAAQTIERTLISVAEQTYSSVQYLVIDGASTDNTLEKVRAICPHAEIYSEPDKGIYDAMNKGLTLAQGDYVWFMNAGDSFYNRYTVETVMQAAEKAGADILYGDTLLIDENGDELGLRKLRPPKLLNAESFKNGMLVCHQAFVVRRSIAGKYDEQYRYSADYDWCIRCMHKAEKIEQVDSILARYLNKGTTTQHHRASLLERYYIMSKEYGCISTFFRHLYFLLRRKR
ncbi:glycosyltransferase family 2 protein [Porphyromonas crevioricanis]|uniref:Glycosyl transferase family 2 n=1 Tax=Porphyromonas crevioricanis TaxID=393921 RepID=A0AB34PG17_9PORP|nr:glycosyltransferase family 2 protein [Porphyromonas crevioricanis]KGN95105.1 glycosyl transferase family 2 [Porphyromonas crevioricanis]